MILYNCRFLQETYTIEDCILYDTLTSNNNRFNNFDTGASYTTTGLYIANNGGHWTKMDLKTQLAQNIQIELDIVNTYGSNTPKLYTEFEESLDVAVNGVQQSVNATGSLKYVIQNNTVVTTLNNTQLSSQTLNYSNGFYWRFWTGGNRGFRIANLKVKPL